MLEWKRRNELILETMAQSPLRLRSGSFESAGASKRKAAGETGILKWAVKSPSKKFSKEGVASVFQSNSMLLLTSLSLLKPAYIRGDRLRKYAGWNTRPLCQLQGYINQHHPSTQEPKLLTPALTLPLPPPPPIPAGGREGGGT